ncbi:MAG TPA: YhcH/YjgK/YiaL family protein [Deltaproteobacteria bacterium]|nr:YhcH/YjgK/YiaL family protein [Deltaproteobacteria bacterium]
MAVVGLLHDVLGNQAFSELIARGLKYLATLGEDAFSGLALGEVMREVLQGDALVALHQAYETRGPDQARFEAHQRSIDIQYLFEGRETLRLASLDDATPLSAYDAEKDTWTITPRSASRKAWCASCILRTSMPRAWTCRARP